MPQIIMKLLLLKSKQCLKIIMSDDIFFWCKNKINWKMLKFFSSNLWFFLHKVLKGYIKAFWRLEKSRGWSGCSRPSIETQPKRPLQNSKKRTINYNQYLFSTYIYISIYIFIYIYQSIYQYIYIYINTCSDVYVFENKSLCTIEISTSTIEH